MFEIIREHPKAALVAILFHVIVILVVGVSVDWSSIEKSSSGDKHTKIVNAVVVDQKLVEKELKKIKDAERKRKRKQDRAARKAREAKSARKREEKRLAELKKKSKQEKAKHLKLKKKRETEQKAALAIKKKHEAEQKTIKKRKEKLKKERIAKEKAAKELQEKLEKERIASEKAAKEFQDKLDKEAKLLAAERMKIRQSELGKHSDIIKQHIQNNWRKPAYVEKNGAHCEVIVTAIPSGDVVDVTMLKSCGNKIVDQSVLDAVNRASPLPMPSSETDLINDFRKFKLKIDYQPK